MNEKEDGPVAAAAAELGYILLLWAQAHFELHIQALKLPHKIFLGSKRSNPAASMLPHNQNKKKGKMILTQSCNNEVRLL